MKMIIVFAAVLAIALAAPAPDQQEVVLVKEVPHNNIGVDGYTYNYELSNGQTVEETAVLKKVAGEDEPVLSVTGSFSYVDPATNQRYTVTYTADESGFHPTGDHIPS